METHVESASVENMFLALNLQSCDVLVIVIGRIHTRDE